MMTTSKDKIVAEDVLLSPDDIIVFPYNYLSSQNLLITTFYKDSQFSNPCINTLSDIEQNKKSTANRLDLIQSGADNSRHMSDIRARVIQVQDSSTLTVELEHPLVSERYAKLKIASTNGLPGIHVYRTVIGGHDLIPVRHSLLNPQLQTADTEILTSSASVSSSPRGSMHEASARTSDLSDATISPKGSRRLSDIFGKGALNFRSTTSSPKNSTVSSPLMSHRYSFTLRIRKSYKEKSAAWNRLEISSNSPDVACISTNASISSWYHPLITPDALVKKKIEVLLTRLIKVYRDKYQHSELSNIDGSNPDTTTNLREIFYKEILLILQLSFERNKTLPNLFDAPLEPDSRVQRLIQIYDAFVTLEQADIKELDFVDTLLIQYEWFLQSKFPVKDGGKPQIGTIISHWSHDRDLHGSDYDKLSGRAQQIRDLIYFIQVACTQQTVSLEEEFSKSTIGQNYPKTCAFLNNNYRNLFFDTDNKSDILKLLNEFDRYQPDNITPGCGADIKQGVHISNNLPEAMPSLTL